MKNADPAEMDGHIIECTFDSETKTWLYLRERKDKDTPNAYHVFEKVMRSITDNITQEDLVSFISQAIQKPAYQKDLIYLKQQA